MLLTKRGSHAFDISISDIRYLEHLLCLFSYGNHMIFCSLTANIDSSLTSLNFTLPSFYNSLTYCSVFRFKFWGKNLHFIQWYPRLCTWKPNMDITAVSIAMLCILSRIQTVLVIKRFITGASYWSAETLNGLRHSASFHDIKTTTTTTKSSYLTGRNFPVVIVSDKRYFIPRLAIVDYIIQQK